jgi:hypothetical protein
MMPAPEGKKTVLFSFDDELLLDSRKALFRKKVSLQQFVTFVFHRLTLADESAVNLLNGAAEYNEEVLSQEDKDEISKIDPRALYDLFEREDNK